MDTRFNVTLSPCGGPTITYGVDSEVNRLKLTGSTILDFALDLDKGTHKFFIVMDSKTNDTPDMQVSIDRIEFEGISTDRMKWAGLYYPNYPEPWASEQTGPLPLVLTNSTVMGWNGRWELEFTTPIFTWIHKLEMLGWIYE